jgi:hypothetical protein
MHVRTPPNDGALSFGQAVVAAACDRGEAPLVSAAPDVLQGA